MAAPPPLPPVGETRPPSEAPGWNTVGGRDPALLPVPPYPKELTSGAVPAYGTYGGGGGGGGGATPTAPPVPPPAVVASTASVYGNAVGSAIVREFPLRLGDGVDVSIGLSWDMVPGREAVDLDAQALMFSSAGVLVDAAFYNQLSACDGAVKHSGDNRTGEGDGDDETIVFDLDELIRKDIIAIMVVVTCYDGGTFEDVKTAKAEVRGLGGAPLTALHVGCTGRYTSLVLCSIYRRSTSDSSWIMRELGVLGPGRDFSECLPMVKEQLATFASIRPEATLLSLDRTFMMRKNEVAFVPFKHLYIGLGWDCDEAVDLDASVWLMGGGKKTLVNFSHLEEPGVVHTGDNLTGEGDGDDEVINLDLDRVKASVQSLIITVHCFSKGKSFKDVSNAYVRLVVPRKEHVLAYYPLMDDLRTQGLIFCRLDRADDGWRMTALGHGVGGTTASSRETKRVLDGELPPVIAPPLESYKPPRGGWWWEKSRKSSKSNKTNDSGDSDKGCAIM